MQIKYGTTRISLLFGRFCLKIPNPSYCYTHFLLGLINNISEARWGKLRNPNLNRVYFTFPGGLFSLQERTYPISLQDFQSLEYEEFITETMEIGKLPIENKLDSFGRNSKQRIVGIDFH